MSVIEASPNPSPYIYFRDGRVVAFGFFESADDAVGAIETSSDLQGAVPAVVLRGFDDVAPIHASGRILTPAQGDA